MRARDASPKSLSEIQEKEWVYYCRVALEVLLLCSRP